MILMPYETTICSVYKMDKIIQALKRAEIERPFSEVVTTAGNVIRNLYFVTHHDEHLDIPNFTQMVNLGTATEPKLVFDGRPFMRIDLRTGEHKITAKNDYTFQYIRGALTLAMLEEGSTESSLIGRRLGDVPAVTFSRWITMALTQRFNLDLAAQLRMNIVAAYYYYSLFDKAMAKDPEARLEMVSTIARVTRADQRLVMEVSDNISSLATVNDFAKSLSTDTGTIRMGELKFADLFTLVSSSFFGVNYRENVGVALEHLPTFIAMVYTVLVDRSYRKTVLSRRAETAGKARDLTLFSEQVYRHVSEQFI